MISELTYYVHTGVISATLGDQQFRVPAHCGTGGDAGSWARMRGLEVEWEVVEYQAGSGREVGLQVLQESRTLPVPRHAATCSHYTALKTIVVVDDRAGGFLVHGWPPCLGSRCLVISHGWDNLLKALPRGRRGLLRIV